MSSKTIIKAGEVKALAKGMYSVDLRDISAKTEAMLQAARVEAERIVDEATRLAKQERETARSIGYDNGHDAGLAEGRETGHAAALKEAREQFQGDHASLVDSVSTLVETFSQRREQLFVAARRDVVALAIAIARRLSTRMPDEATVAVDMAVQACEEALELIGPTTELTIRLHPDDLASFELFLGSPGESDAADSSTARALRAMTSDRHVRFTADGDIARGGAVVRTADCEIDATVGERVDRIADELVTNWRERLATLGI